MCPTIMPNPLETLNDGSIPAFCKRRLYRNVILSICVIVVIAVVTLLFIPSLFVLCPSMFVIVVIVYISALNKIRSNVELNTEQRRVILMMLNELIRMQILLENGIRVVYEDQKGSIGFVNEILLYDWCDRLVLHSGGSYHFVISQTRIHDIINLAKEHNYYRQKLEDVIIPNRTADGILKEKHAKYVRVYCEMLQMREYELARILPKTIDKGKEMVKLIGFDICKHPNSISS